MKEFNFLSASSTVFAILLFLIPNVAATAIRIRHEQSEHEAPGDRSLRGEWFRLQRCYALQGSRPENGILHWTKNVGPDCPGKRQDFGASFH